MSEESNEVKIMQYCTYHLHECIAFYFNVCHQYKKLREANIEHNIKNVFATMHLHEFIVRKDVADLLRGTLKRRTKRGLY